MHIWRLMKADKQLGQAQNIRSLLPHCHSLIVHCPSLDGKICLMISGNVIQCHLIYIYCLTKQLNTDPHDISLYHGHTYFPPNTEYKAYIQALPSQSPKKSAPCDHFTAINAQDHKKFKNMDITGIVTINCSHILIKSTVDLQLGEKFANTDYALAHAICNTKPHPEEILFIDHDFAHKSDHHHSYDISCGFSKNVIKCFQKNFPNEVEFVRNMKWLIPLLYVQNHQDNCTYLYSSAYQENTRNFQGESAEQPWIELNQLAPQTQQMNNSHHQDTIIDHHSHWNWAKTTNMAATLS
ncbi:hypothetical protein CVT25_013257 [Psilocybe cyanescens]|uniref:Uncharacterized protein n=1 Tax=Psilocybe cyanescens TaxID=93625 RepID=A0A409X0V4_PSICY|nr:hypothetical protein CVT25_013257 [Psilocybe cyanescens]